MRMRTRIAAFVTTVVSLPSVVHGNFPPIWHYQPQNDVSAYMAIARDLRAMDEALLTETDEGFDDALKVYQRGAYSDPYTQLNVELGLPYDLEEGTILVGTDNDGTEIEVTVAYASYQKGDTAFRVAFRSTDLPCRMSGMPVPELDGCLLSVGELTAPGQTQKISYTFTFSDIKNYHAIQMFSLNAHSKFKPNGNTHAGFFKDFQMYVDYFGSPTFANDIIMAAFERQKFESKHVTLDFAAMNPRARRSIIVHTAAFMIVSQFVIRDIETSMTHCDHHCSHGLDDCNKGAIHSLDGAVALYTGALFLETGRGNLMYGLAENMCREFRTCGEDGTKDDGSSKVNIEIFRQFNEMQENLKGGNCLEAKINKEAIANQLFVPLLQATLLAVHMDFQTDSMESRSERVVFTTSILPLIHRCSPSETLDVALLTDPTEPLDEDSFSVVKETFDLHYRCLGVSCSDVGGIWDSDANQYVKGAEGCYVHLPSDDSPKGEHQWVMYGIGFGGAVLLACCCIRRHCRFGRRRQNRRRDLSRGNSKPQNDGADDDSDSDSEDGFSVNSIT